MLVAFATDADADIAMFGDIALAMLKMLGHGATVPVEGSDADDPVVSMAHQALPHINLLAAAAKAASNVLWK